MLYRTVVRIMPEKPVPLHLFSDQSQRYRTTEETALLIAVEEYRRQHERRWPTVGEILLIAKSIGYRKVAEPRPLADVFEELRAEVETDMPQPIKSLSRKNEGKHYKPRTNENGRRTRPRLKD